MSTNPDAARGARAGDVLVGALSTWLAGHTSVDELRAAVAAVPLSELAPGEREAVEELLVELRAGGSPAQLEVAVRETLEALALGE